LTGLRLRPGRRSGSLRFTGAVTYAFATSDRFERLSRKERDRLEALSKLDEFAEGQVILVAGRHSDSIYLIASGAVDVRVKTRSGDLTIAQLEPGDLFGELERFAQLPEGVRHVARTRTVVRAIAKNPLRHEVLVHRDMASGLLAAYGRSISEKLRAANDVAVRLGRRPEILPRIDSDAFDKALRMNFTVAFRVLESLCGVLGQAYRDTILHIIANA
jgi:CRP-like cAMP-binding protein